MQLNIQNLCLLGWDSIHGLISIVMQLTNNYDFKIMRLVQICQVMDSLYDSFVVEILLIRRI